MKIGDTIHHSAWLTGEETVPDVERFRDRVKEGMAELCHDMGFIHGPVRWLEKRPGEEGVPEVPDHIQGQDVSLLIGEADILAKAPDIAPRKFVGDLDPKDLARLRQITRAAWAKHMPKLGRLTDAQVDDIIEDLGPDAALESVRQAVDGGTVH